MIDPYEKILMITRNQSKVAGPFAMGIMEESNAISIGELKLEDDEYYKVSGVNASSGDSVLLARVDDSYVLLGKVVE